MKLAKLNSLFIPVFSLMVYNACITISEASQEKTQSRAQEGGQAKPHAKDQSQEQRSTAGANESVWISRPDGALSCSPEVGQSLSEGEKELSGAQIPILESRKGSDGKMHIQMCGASQGSTNAFLIPKSHLKKAMSLGYQVDKR